MHAYVHAGGPARWFVTAIAAGGRHSLCLAVPLHTRPTAASEASGLGSEVEGGSEASLAFNGRCVIQGCAGGLQRHALNT
jgi:hypothetical protein